MKHRELCKRFFSKTLQNEISASYDEQARRFQKNYNTMHPDAHIWRHILYERTFIFYRNGQVLSVRVEIVRFIFAGTNKTFTYLGNLFRAFSCFPWEFLNAVVHDPESSVALEICAETLIRWKKLLFLQKPHNLTHGISVTDAE